MRLDHLSSDQQTIKQQFTELNQAARRLLSRMDDESWEDVVQLTQEWDERIRILVRDLTAEQIIGLESDIKKIAVQNSKIKKQLEVIRAKVLTLIQENNHSRNAIKHYNNSV